MLDAEWLEHVAESDVDLRWDSVQRLVADLPGVPAGSGILKARENALKMLPPLFDGFQVRESIVDFCA